MAYPADAAPTNTMTYVLPQLLAQGLLSLREMAIMPRFVNRAYEAMAGEKGSTIDVPIASAITASAVTPNFISPNTAAVAPTKVSIALDKWYEAPFFLTDKEMLEVMSGTIPLQAQEAVKALANQVDADILALYKDIYGYAGTAGTTPFATDLTEFLDARKALNNQLAPLDPRYVALNPDAEANALGLRAFQDASFRGDAAGITEGIIGRKLGSTWFVDQLIPTHAVGTMSVPGTSAVTIGTKAVTVSTATGSYVVGDIVTLGVNDTQTYVVTGVTGTAPTTAFTIEPAAKVGQTTGAILRKDAHVVNLAFHRDAFALATRPFAGADPMGLGQFSSAVDPISGLTLRLEVTREFKRTRFSYDILYGVKTVRRELATRIAG